MKLVAPYLTLLVIAALVYFLYTNRVRPSIAFVTATLVLLLGQVISLPEVLEGLSNPQIILIFLLILLTAGLQRNSGVALFKNILQKTSSLSHYRFRLMTMCAALSAIINNTPIVALMIPIAREWAQKHRVPASQILIPLSFATMAGGMITVVGTSTNLVLNGLLGQNGLPELGLMDFLPLGIGVTIIVILFLQIAGKYLLPWKTDSVDSLKAQLQDYVVETLVNTGSELVGRSIQEAGLRNLKEIFLVEIKRGNRILSFVGPEGVIQEWDVLFFAGNTLAITGLINQNPGLSIPEQMHVQQNRFFAMSEAVIPSGSMLIGASLKDLRFRDTYKASVISIYRQGENVTGGLGNVKLLPGDMLLMLTGSQFQANVFSRDLVIFSRPEAMLHTPTRPSSWPSVLALAVLILGVLGIFPLFTAALLGIGIMVFAGVLRFDELKKSFDADLLIILVCSLAIGEAIRASGLAALVATGPFQWVAGGPLWLMLALLFTITMLLTQLVTNVAAVSIMFPIAQSLSMLYPWVGQAFFVVLAFAASASFISPVGYQTNMMVLGPGNYKFADFAKVGFPITILYGVWVIYFVYMFYC